MKKLSKLEEELSVFNDSLENYPQSVRPHSLPLAFTQLDNTASFTSVGDHCFQVIIPAGSSRRQCALAVHRSFAKFSKILEVEAQYEAVAHQQLEASVEVFKAEAEQSRPGPSSEETGGPFWSSSSVIEWHQS